MIVKQCVICGHNTDNPICPDCKKDLQQTDPNFEEDLFENEYYYEEE